MKRIMMFGIVKFSVLEKQKMLKTITQPMVESKQDNITQYRRDMETY